MRFPGRPSAPRSKFWRPTRCRRSFSETTDLHRPQSSRARSSSTTALAYQHLANGIVITPSHNPPEDGGFKYNSPNGGPADTDGVCAAARNPLLHAFGSLVGASAAPNMPAAPTHHPVDPTAATASTGWAVQLAAPKSEAEANSDASRLNAKYASALNGSTIGVHKAVVNGDTIYRLRVVGLSKANSAALCARLKGDGGQCFIAGSGLSGTSLGPERGSLREPI